MSANLDTHLTKKKAFDTAGRENQDACMLFLSRKNNNMASGHGFSATLEKKLKDLSVTVHSIQGISQWVIHHRKHAKAVVAHWYKELQSGEYIYIYVLQRGSDARVHVLEMHSTRQFKPKADPAVFG